MFLSRTHIQLLRFMVTGAVVIATDVGVYFLLLRVLPAPAAKTLSFITGGIVAYLMNKYWTFGKTGRDLREFGRFWVANGVAMAANVSVNQLVLELTEDAKEPAVLCATLASGITAFIVQRSWVFHAESS